MTDNRDKFLKELCEDQPCHQGSGEYCVLKEMMMHDKKYNERLLCQAGCVNKFKYEQSDFEKTDIGWQEAWKRWVEFGYAEKFAEHYTETDTVKQVYQKITKK
jgi:hypothetical protein